VQGFRALTFARLAVLLALIAPVWLGPAMAPLVIALGGAPEHHCLCGMKHGECGCPECEALEHARAHEHDSPLPTIRSTCDTDGVLIAQVPAMPFVASFHVVAAAACPSTRASEPEPAIDPVQRLANPPLTPPPRHTRA